MKNFKIIMSIFFLFLFVNCFIFAQANDFKKDIGETFLIQGDAQSYVLNNLNFKSTILTSGESVTLNEYENNWLKVTIKSSNAIKWIYYDPNIINTYSLKKVDAGLINLNDRVEALEKQIAIINSNQKEVLDKLKTLYTPKEISEQKSSSTQSYSKPTSKEVEMAINDLLKNEVPVKWVGNLMGGEKAVLSAMQIVDIGTFNEKKDYWPMKIHCMGTCKLRNPINQGKSVTFDKVGDFKIYQNDYGKWIAQFNESPY